LNPAFTVGIAVSTWWVMGMGCTTLNRMIAESKQAQGLAKTPTTGVAARGAYLPGFVTSTVGTIRLTDT